MSHWGRSLRHARRLVLMPVGAALAVSLSLAGTVPAVRAQGAPPPPPGDAQPPAPPSEGGAVERTPPRLSFVHGEVSFWRPGGQDWTPAQINTPLAPGDALYVATGGTAELQVGPRAFVRAGGDTQLGLENLEPDFLQFKVTAGHVSLDLRGRAAGHTVEFDTPHAVFSIDATGYYRFDVSDDTTAFLTRRGGRATMIPAGGEPSAIVPNEEVIVEGNDDPRVATYVAPDVDAWDRWNYARTDQIIDAVSTRYVPSGVYGVEGLDHYGTWRVVGTYGPVWIPRGVAAGWAPYSTGRWIWDPYYGWTWVDTAPWGWAPYHYGRWVHLDPYWAWAPGPLVVAPTYAPALVAFFTGGHFGISIGVGLGAPAVSWCALGWGEPVVPWWGAHVGAPWWGGWGGPHVVNNVVVNHTSVVNVTNINVYQNEHVRNGVVAVPADRFGRGGFDRFRVGAVDPHHLEPVRGRLDVRPVAASLAPAGGHRPRPPEGLSRRPVVATRPPHDTAPTLRAEGVEVQHTAPPPRLVAAPHGPHTALTAPRPPFGQQGTAERPRPPLPPRFEASRRPGQMRMPPDRVQGQTVEQQPASRPMGPAPAIEPHQSARPPRRPSGAPPVAGGAPSVPQHQPQLPSAMERRPPEPPAMPQGHAPSAMPAIESRRPAPPAREGRAAEAQVPPRSHRLPGEPANRLYHSPPQMRMPEPHGGAVPHGRGDGKAAARDRREKH